MLDYELRILGTDVRHSVVLKGCYFSDDAAIKARLRTAGHKAVEVWRGLVCIFRSPSNSNLAA